ncbi:hypothetical protein D3C80_1972340 [compost metagenome]
MVFRRSGNGDKYAYMLLAGGIFFYPCNGAHQLHAADFRVRYTSHHFIYQVNALACSDILQLTPLQVLHIGKPSGLHFTDGLLARIGMFF